MTSGFHTYRPSEHLPGPISGGIIAIAAALLVLLGMMLPGMVGIREIEAFAPLAIPLLAAVAFLIWINERVWIMMAVTGHLMMMLDATREAIGPGEAGFIALGLGGLGIWFVKEVAIHRRQLVRTGFDLLLLSFMILGTVVSLLACVLHGGDLLSYVKEYGQIFDLLLYFPLRKFLRNRDDVAILLVLFVIVATMNGLYSFASYRERLTQAVFQWQITASRSNVNESTSLALFVMAATLFAYARKLWLSTVALGLVAAAIIFLVISFSRSPIAAAVFAAGVMVTLIPWRNSRRVVTALVLSLVLGVGVAYLIFPQIVSNIGASIAERLLTLTSATSDRSFNARIVESTTLLSRYILPSPVIGNGFGVPFSFLDPLTNTTVTGTFVHNGYIWSLFKFGVPVALLLLWVLVYPIVRLMMKAPGRHAGFHRALMAGCVGYLISALIVHFTSNHMAQVSTTLNFAICWAILDYVGRSIPERQEAATGEQAGRILPAGA